MRLFLLVPVLTFSLACNRTPAQSQTTAEAAAQQPAGAQAAASQAPADSAAPEAEAAKPVPATLPEVVARVNGEPLPRQEFERAIRNIEARAGQSIPADKRDQIYRTVLDELIAFRLVLAEARARNITIAPEEIKARVDEIKKQFPTEAAFQEALKERNMTAADLESETRTELLVNKTLEAEVAPKGTVAPQELDAYYKENPEQFKQPEQVRASHILFPVEAGATPEAKQQVRTQAEAVLKRAKAGEDFAGLAREFSKDASAPNGGDLNFFPRGQMVPAFEQAAFGMKVGEISDVVESEFGFHIIKVTDRKPEQLVPLEQVSDRLASFLKQRKQQQAATAFVQSLRSKYKVEVLI
ncbi:MAG TPA: peptidylprolyl isomerase [Vicinamibacterales bacterium]